MYSFSYLEPVSCSMSSSNFCLLTCIQVSQEAGQVVWYSYLFQNFPQFIVIHTVRSFGIVNKAEIDVFLELSSFSDDPADVGNLISGFSAFSKASLNIWNFMVHILLKPGLENFEHYFTSMSTSKEWWLHGCRRAERSYSTFKVRRGSREEIPLAQGKERWLHFAGASMKRYTTSKVRETQVRQ